MPTSWPHSCTWVALCCACLQELAPGYLSQKSATPSPHGPLLQPHLVLSYSMLLTPVLGYYQQTLVIACNPWLAPQPSRHQCLRHISPLSFGILYPYSWNSCKSSAQTDKPHSKPGLPWWGENFELVCTYFPWKCRTACREEPGLGRAEKIFSFWKLC